MTALRKILIEEETVFTAPVSRAPVAKLYVVTKTALATAPAAAAEGHALKNIVLFFLAPFIGLAYTVSFPFVGLAALAVLAGQVAAKYEAVRVTATVLKNVGLALAAPVLGLAYIVLFPFIGLTALAWIGGRAVLAAGAR
jgi:hypothetical protein